MLKMRVERRNAIGAVLLLALLMTYKVSVTMFMHTHVVDGVAVAHSHPFTSSNHSHSSSQIIVIGQLSTFNGVEHASYDEINVLDNNVEEIEISNLELNVINAYVACVLLRAPPVSC